MPIRYTFDEETRKIYVAIWEDVSDEVCEFYENKGHALGSRRHTITHCEPSFPKNVKCVVQDREFYGYWIYIEKPNATPEEIEVLSGSLPRSVDFYGGAAQTEFFTKDNPAENLTEHEDIKLAWQKYVDERYPGWTFKERCMSRRFVECTKHFQFAFQFTRNGPRLPRILVDEIELPDGITDIISYEDRYQMHSSFHEKNIIKIKP